MFNLHAKIGSSNLTPALHSSMERRKIRELAEAQDVILRALEPGLLTQEMFQGNVIDFGSGDTAAGAARLHSFGGNVTAIELDPVSYEFSRRLGLLPEERIKMGDGLELLRSQANSVNLISAFYLGPETCEGNFVINFLDASCTALTTNGGMIVTSDPFTLKILVGIVEHQLYPLKGIQVNENLWVGTKYSSDSIYSVDQIRASLPDDITRLLSLLKNLYES